MTDARADPLSGLDAAALNAIYHEEGPGALTRSEFIGPIVRLLQDGAVRQQLVRQVVDHQDVGRDLVHYPAPAGNPKSEARNPNVQNDRLFVLSFGI